MKKIITIGLFIIVSLNFTGCADMKEAINKTIQQSSNKNRRTQSFDKYFERKEKEAKEKQIKRLEKIEKEKQDYKKNYQIKLQEAKQYLTKNSDNNKIFSVIDKYFMDKNIYTKSQFETTVEYNKRLDKVKQKILNQKFIFNIHNYEIKESEILHYSKIFYDADHQSLYAGIFIHENLLQVQYNDFSINGRKVFNIEGKLPKSFSIEKHGVDNVYYVYKLDGKFKKKEAKELVDNLDIKIVAKFKRIHTLEEIKMKEKDNNQAYYLTRIMTRAYLQAGGRNNERFRAILKYTFPMDIDMVIVYDKRTNKIYKIFF